MLHIYISIISCILNYGFHITTLKIKYMLYRINFFIVIHLKLIINKRVGRGARGWGGWWKKLKQRNKKIQIVEFRVAMISTRTHNGPIFHYKAQRDMH